MIPFKMPTHAARVSGFRVNAHVAVQAQRTVFNLNNALL